MSETGILLTIEHLRVNTYAVRATLVAIFLQFSKGRSVKESDVVHDVRKQGAIHTVRDVKDS